MEIDRNYFRNLFIQITHNIKNVNIITIITLVIISILILSGVNINKDFFFLGKLVTLIIISYSFYRNITRTYELSTSIPTLFTSPELRPMQNEVIMNYIYSFMLLFIVIFLFISLFQ